MAAMHTDAWELPVTTSSARALERYDGGVRGLLGWEAGALDEFVQATREDPGLAVAHAGAAVCLFLEEQFTEARAAAGDWRRTIERIEPLRGRIVELGGSRAQRDVFHDTFLEACFRAGDMDRARRYVTERVARRPDRYWLERVAA